MSGVTPSDRRARQQSRGARSTSEAARARQAQTHGKGTPKHAARHHPRSTGKHHKKPRPSRTSRVSPGAPAPPGDSGQRRRRRRARRCRRPRRRSRSRRRGGCCGGPASARRPGQAEALAGQPVEAVVQCAHASVGPAVLHGPAPTDDEGNALAPGRRLGPGPLLVARPDGPLRPAAGRADDVHLARLVRELQRKGQRPAADARPERAVPRTRAGQLPGPVHGGHDRTRRCWSSSTASTTRSGNRTRTTGAR